MTTLFAFRVEHSEINVDARQISYEIGLVCINATKCCRDDLNLIIDNTKAIRIVRTYIYIVFVSVCVPLRFLVLPSVLCGYLLSYYSYSYFPNYNIICGFVWKAAAVLSHFLFPIYSVWSKMTVIKDCGYMRSIFIVVLFFCLFFFLIFVLWMLIFSVLYTQITHRGHRSLEMAAHIFSRRTIKHMDMDSIQTHCWVQRQNHIRCCQ